jgi:dethiobiotin synthetase
MKAVFITGTDTGVGKTWVSCALMRQLIGEGLRVVGMKPVASGAQMHAGELRNDDALQLMANANVAVPYDIVNPYCFAPPIAPHIAAHQAGTTIAVDVIQNAYRELSTVADVVVVEGVGGWAVPINAEQTMADVAAILNLPVIMVVGMRLGCLNHALLTAQNIQSTSLTLAAWVANIIDPVMPMLQENIETLRSRINAPLAAISPHVSAASQANAIHFNVSLYLNLN